MAKKKGTQNRTNKNMMTSSAQRERANAAIDGRGGRLASRRSGASTASSELYEKKIPEIGFPGYRISEQEANKRAWENRNTLVTYTRTKSGAMSVNGRVAGGTTTAMTPKNDDGTPVLNEKGEVRKSGRAGDATRRQRDYDIRKGLNNITQRAMDAMIRTGQVRVVNGNMVGEGGNIIRQKADGNYTMGLATG